MKRIATLVVAFLVLVPAGAAAHETAAGKAKLRFMSSAPLKVKGTGFVSSERVVVRVTSRRTITRKRTTASRSGGWVMSFPEVRYERCAGLTVSAVGNQGSRAGLKMPQPLCPPPL
jgi:hypothetical protein